MFGNLMAFLFSTGLLEGSFFIALKVLVESFNILNRCKLEIFNFLKGNWKNETLKVGQRKIVVLKSLNYGFFFKLELLNICWIYDDY